MLKKAAGVLSAKLDEENGELFVVYDLLETDYAHIEEVLEKIGVEPDDTLWQHLKESFIRFAEENEKAALSAHADFVSYSPMEDMDEIFDE